MNINNIKELKRNSDRNMQILRESVGPLGVDAAATLLVKHADMFRLGAFHETSSKNIPQIKKSSSLYSYDELKRRAKKAAVGMTYGETKHCDIFNTVTHFADSYTDFVYSRPMFNNIQSRSRGVYWKEYPFREDTWFSFQDGNQVTFDDKICIELGISVGKGFNSYDVYMGSDIIKAVALRALEQIAQTDYMARLKKYKYDKCKARHDAEPNVYGAPDEFNNMDLEKAVDFYCNGMIERDAAYRAYSDACWGYDPDKLKERLREAGLELEYGAPLPVTREILDHPKFEEFFVKTCAGIMREASQYGQIAVPTRMSLRGAVIVNGPKIEKTFKPLPPNL